LKNNFICSNCGAKQSFRKVFALSNSSKWKCRNCGTLIGPKFMKPISGFIGFLSTAIPASYLIFIAKVLFWKGIFIGALFGLFTYLIALIYFYNNVEFEKK